ncbi:hypothetical protein CEXT_780791 [Caerostris extrusa]|uniref:Uncharacterized protein n=1 Tax=Caerostris extrusa TaxID=172846 RepID=A0AAV4XDF4_CAEEX|nr:hypothetical protein CEXT_780791 [Caerostris extrusa]
MASFNKLRQTNSKDLKRFKLEGFELILLTNINCWSDLVENILVLSEQRDWVEFFLKYDVEYVRFGYSIKIVVFMNYDGISVLLYISFPLIWVKVCTIPK